jgi:hypothetical protein
MPSLVYDWYEQKALRGFEGNMLEVSKRLKALESFRPLGPSILLHWMGCTDDDKFLFSCLCSVMEFSIRSSVTSNPIQRATPLSPAILHRD